MERVSCLHVMELSKAIGAALKDAREAKGLTQEDFVGVSGRSYLSEIERGLKSPTLEKLDQLAGRIGIHPLELLLACYVKQGAASRDELLSQLAERSTNKEADARNPLRPAL